MPRKTAPTAPKSDALRVRFDPETQARVHAHAGPGGVSEFIRQAVEERLAKLEAQPSVQPDPTPEPVAAVVDLEPLLQQLRTTSSQALDAYKGGATAHARRLEAVLTAVERVEHLVRYVANVTAMVAKLVGLKDLPPLPLAAQLPAASARPAAPPMAPARPTPPPASPPQAPAQQARKASPR